MSDASQNGQEPPESAHDADGQRAPEKLASVARAGFGVAASPFNEIKLKLGLALLGGGILALVLWLLPLTTNTAMGVFALYGLGVMLWFNCQIRQVLHQHLHKSGGDDHGAQ